MSGVVLVDVGTLLFLKAVLVLGFGLLVAHGARLSASHRHFVLLLCLCALPLLGAIAISSRYLDITGSDSPTLFGDLVANSFVSLATLDIPALAPWHGTVGSVSIREVVDQRLTTDHAEFLLLAAYLLVTAVLLSRWWFVRLRSARLVRGACPLPAASSQQLWRSIAGDRSNPLCHSTATNTPVVWGVRKPVVVLPADWASWKSARQRSALRHEHAHIRRRDVFTTMTVGVIACLFWFVPLVWIAQQRLRLLAELACDDAVLRAGAQPEDYAEQLIGIARRTLLDGPVGVAMAAPSSLKQRITALMNHQQRRKDMTRKQKIQITALAGILLAPLAATGVAPTAADTQTAKTIATAAPIDSQLSRLTALVEVEQYEQARALATSLLPRTRSGADRAQLLNKLGYTNFQLDNYPAAIQHFTEVIAEAPSELKQLRTQTHYSLAQLHFVAENYQQSLKHIRDWQSLANDTGPIPFIFMGQVYYQLNDYPNAVVALEEGLGRAESEHQIRENWWALLAYLEFELENFERCAEVLGKLQEHFPSDDYQQRLAGLQRLIAEA